VFFISVSIFATAVAYVIFLEASVTKASPSTLVTRRYNGTLSVVRKRKKYAQSNGVPSSHEIKSCRSLSVSELNDVLCV